VLVHVPVICLVAVLEADTVPITKVAAAGAAEVVKL
jgi:hypothetical protein